MVDSLDRISVHCVVLLERRKWEKEAMKSKCRDREGERERALERRTNPGKEQRSRLP